MKPPEEQVRRELVGQWLHKADTDLEAAESLLASGRSLLYPSCFHSQQAAEKYLKGFLVRNRIDFPRTHDLKELLDLAEPVNSNLARSLQDAIVLTRYGVEVRYPGDMPEPTVAEAQEALRLAQSVRKAILAAPDLK
jgi:HEPN domain-containing protein